MSNNYDYDLFLCENSMKKEAETLRKEQSLVCNAEEKYTIHLYKTSYVCVAYNLICSVSCRNSFSKVSLKKRHTCQVSGF